MVDLTLAFNSQDFISNSPYFLPYNSVVMLVLENSELDQPIIL